MTSRLNVNLNDETAVALRTLTEKHETSATEAVRRAVSVYKYFHDKQRDGHTIQLEDRKSVTVVKLV